MLHSLQDQFNNDGLKSPTGNTNEYIIPIDSINRKKTSFNPPPPRSTTPGRSNKFDSPFQISDTPSYRKIRGSVNHNYLKFPLIKDMQNLKVVSKSRTTHIKGY